MLYKALIAILVAQSSVDALQIPAGTAGGRVSAPKMADSPPVESFFGGKPKPPEGAKCVFRGDACTRGRCKVNKGPCADNHASMKK